MDTQVKALIESTPADFNQPQDDYRQTRESMRPLHGRPIAASTTVIHASTGEVGYSILSCEQANTSERLVVFCHGGGFVSCGMEEYLFYAEWISEQWLSKVVTVDYRLAPETPFPGALEDCLAVYKALLAEGVDPSRILFAGDSCGGALALCCLVLAKQQGLKMPAGFVGFTPWLDLSASHPSHRQDQRDPFITSGWLQRRAADYLNGEKPQHPLASPLYADLRGLPPLMLQHGTIDITRDEGKALCKKALAAGVIAEYDCAQDMVHGFHGLIGMLPQADAAWQRSADFVNRHCPAE